jgi:hypothetical protein
MMAPWNSFENGESSSLSRISSIVLLMLYKGWDVAAMYGFQETFCGETSHARDISKTHSGTEVFFVTCHPLGTAQMALCIKVGDGFFC